MWNKNFYKSLFKNVLLYMNGRLSKIRSVHMYAMTQTVYFDCRCRFYKMKARVNNDVTHFSLAVTTTHMLHHTIKPNTINYWDIFSWYLPFIKSCTKFKTRKHHYVKWFEIRREISNYKKTVKVTLTASVNALWGTFIHSWTFIQNWIIFQSVLMPFMQSILGFRSNKFSENYNIALVAVNSLNLFSRNYPTAI